MVALSLLLLGTQPAHGAPEACNALDDDGDGATDEDGVCGPCTPAAGGGRVYLVCPGPLGWDASRVDCQGRGYDLAVPSDPVEEALLDGLAPFSAWIGLRDTTGTWSWDPIDGGTATVRWCTVGCSVEPDGPGTCVRYDPGYGSGMLDAGCSDGFGAICEAPCAPAVGFQDLDGDGVGGAPVGCGEPVGAVTDGLARIGPDVQDPLVLVGVLRLEELHIARQAGLRRAGVRQAPQALEGRSQALHDGTIGDPGVRPRVVGVHPGRDLGIKGVLQPAVRVRHRDAMEVDGGGTAGRGERQKGHEQTLQVAWYPS